MIFSLGLVAVATPLGAALAFLLTRTDIPGRRWLEPLVLAPMFISSIVLAFGYTVAVGPTGFLSLWVKKLIGVVPWNIYGLTGLIVIGGLSHVPYVYLYLSSAMRYWPSDLEEAARSAGAPVWRVAIDVTLPLVAPALAVQCGAEPAAPASELRPAAGARRPVRPDGADDLYLQTDDAAGRAAAIISLVAVCVVLIAVTFPLVWTQRRLLARARRYATLGGKGARATPLPLGPVGKALALAAIALWLFVSVGLPIGGITVRAFVKSWGEGVDVRSQLTTLNFHQLLEVQALFRGIVNTVLIATLGGAAAVFVYLLVALANHRWRSPLATMLDYLGGRRGRCPASSSASPSSGCFCSCPSSPSCGRRSGACSSPISSSASPTGRG